MGGWALQPNQGESDSFIFVLSRRSDRFQERVRSLAVEYLDTSLTHSDQAKTKLNHICAMVGNILIPPCRCVIDHTRQVSKEFPVLVKFEENWVIHDYLRVFLKNSSQKAKKIQEQRDRELEAAVKGKNKAKVCTQNIG